MRFFKTGKVFSFMRVAPYCALVSLLVVVATLVALVYPGPKLGTDFVGGTEIEVAFKQRLGSERIRRAVQEGGFSSPDVIKIDSAQDPNRYLIRVQEISVIPESSKRTVERRLCFGDSLPADECPEPKQATDVKWSPGGDKITARFSGPPDLDWIRERLKGIPRIELFSGEHNPTVQSARENKVVVQLVGTGDKLMNALIRGLGKQIVPENPLRVEWIGPKAGAQLRRAAYTSIGISLVLIMAYVALRFDIRFAPGAVVCLGHDAITATGVLMLVGKELNLTTIAALLTIIGFSVNDTVVIYDRVRENLGRLRGVSFPRLIDISVSEMLGRTLLTTGTVILSLAAFLVWGTGTIKDFAFTLIVGMLSGVYSTVYIALPLTHWLDRLISVRGRKAAAGGRQRATA